MYTQRYPVVHRLLTIAGFTLCAMLSTGAGRVPLAVQPLTMAFYCTANVQPTKTVYLSRIFTVAVEKRDVISAWRLYLDGQGIAPGQAVSCDGSVDPAGTKGLMDITRASAANLSMQVVDVDWTFANQVPISDPNMLYGYCQSGTSVANATYFSDVFGVNRMDAMQQPDVATPFMQYVRTKYGNPPGLGVGTGPGPGGRWCMVIGNIADSQRDRKAAQDKLRSATRQIIETGWRYGAAPPN